ncbi:hypothetical protein AB0E67_32880 [Streptomyces sp. NPDC032161]|uniref:hypothetical protein n=1 Tax=unclassified Streptomyces TaxID=2593676 RepID=UPI0033E2BC7E
MLVAAPLVGAHTAHAQPPSPSCFAYPPVPPQLTLSRTVVPAGGTLTFSGNCFAPFELVTAELHSHEIVLGKFRANAKGVVTGRVTIPRKTKPGFHTFELEGRKTGLELTGRIKVLHAMHEHEHHERVHRGPEQSNWSGGSNGSDRFDGRGGPGPHDSDRQGSFDHRSDLAATGSEQALAVGGVAAGLVAAGGGTMLALRRRRSS